MPEIIIIAILLEFILVVMKPIYKARVVYLVPCLCLFLDVMALKDSNSHKCYGVFSAPPYPSLSSKLHHDMALL